MLRLAKTLALVAALTLWAGAAAFADCGNCGGEGKAECYDCENCPDRETCPCADGCQCGEGCECGEKCACGHECACEPKDEG